MYRRDYPEPASAAGAESTVAERITRLADALEIASDHANPFQRTTPSVSEKPSPIETGLYANLARCERAIERLNARQDELYKTTATLGPL